MATEDFEVAELVVRIRGENGELTDVANESLETLDKFNQESEKRATTHATGMTGRAQRRMGAMVGKALGIEGAGEVMHIQHMLHGLSASMMGVVGAGIGVALLIGGMRKDSEELKKAHHEYNLELTKSVSHWSSIARAESESTRVGKEFSQAAQEASDKSEELKSKEEERFHEETSGVKQVWTGLKLIAEMAWYKTGADNTPLGMMHSLQEGRASEMASSANRLRQLAEQQDATQDYRRRADLGGTHSRFMSAINDVRGPQKAREDAERSAQEKITAAQREGDDKRTAMDAKHIEAKAAMDQKWLETALGFTRGTVSDFEFYKVTQERNAMSSKQGEEQTHLTKENQENMSKATLEGMTLRAEAENKIHDTERQDAEKAAESKAQVGVFGFKREEALFGVHLSQLDASYKRGEMSQKSYTERSAAMWSEFATKQAEQTRAFQESIENLNLTLLEVGKGGNAFYVAWERWKTAHKDMNLSKKELDEAYSGVMGVTHAQLEQPIKDKIDATNISLRQRLGLMTTLQAAYEKSKLANPDVDTELLKKQAAGDYLMQMLGAGANSGAANTTWRGSQMNLGAMGRETVMNNPMHLMAKKLGVIGDSVEALVTAVKNALK